MGITEEFASVFRSMPTGKHNLITDVPGVTVGHKTIDNDPLHTGVTVLFPHQGNLFYDKCPAAVHVINGFGKSCGLVQVEELGTIETPLFFTNTLSVGTVWTKAVRYMLEQNPAIGRTTGTVNPVVFECNDGALSDIRALAVTEEDVSLAMSNASDVFEEGAVGAGTGMTCYGLKGGIGSASRLVSVYGKEYTVGAMLLTNFGAFRDLRVAGKAIGELQAGIEEQKDKGSCIIVIATDAPVSDRQLKRVAKRAQSGLARTGGISGNGSGEIALAFTTAYRIPHEKTDSPLHVCQFHDDDMDEIFRASIECVEESVLSSMMHCEHFVGRDGAERKSLRELISE